MPMIKKFKQLAFIMAVTGLASNAHAIAPGLYLGTMLGPSTNSASSQNVLTKSGTPKYTEANPRSQQFFVRPFVGYMMTPFVGTELGFDFYSNINYTSKQPSKMGLVSRVRAIDLQLKVAWPIRQFDVYVKVGPAYTYLTTSGGLNQSSGKTTYLQKVVPAYGIGASYDLTQNWVTDLSINTIKVGGKVKGVTAIAVGFAYHFVDKYCGQFLCDD